MPIAKDSGGDFTPAPAGTHLARCIAVVSLGTQQSKMYPASFKVQLTWELPNEKVKTPEGEAPMVISKDYTLSLNEKARLRHDLDSWRGRGFTPEELKGFDMKKVLGVPCFLNIIHKTNEKGKTYANIAGVSGLPKGTQCPPQYHKSVAYEIEDGKNAVYQSLPEWVQKKIAQCDEWQPGMQGATGPMPTEPEPDTVPPEEDSSDIPF